MKALEISIAAVVLIIGVSTALAEPSGVGSDSPANSGDGTATRPAPGANGEMVIGDDIRTGSRALVGEDRIPALALSEPPNRRPSRPTSATGYPLSPPQIK